MSIRWLKDLTPPDDDDTREVWPITVNLQSRMVVMVNRDGVEQMPVIRGSYAHRIMKANKYTEKKS